MPSYDNATRAQALALKLEGISPAKIESITGIQPNTLYYLFKKTKQRGLNPAESHRILDHHIEDGKRSGRPTKQTPEAIQDVLLKVRRNRYGREKSCT
jgi:hypothetical protein